MAPRGRVPGTNGCRLACFDIFIVFVIAPVVVFAIGVVFAVPLWVIECDEDDPNGSADADVRTNGTSDADQKGGPGDSCLYYNWFLYVVGNLVGLANPLTDVNPESNNGVSEILDLLIAVWSLSLVGVFIGIVGGMSTLARMTDRLNSMGRKLASGCASDQATTNSAETQSEPPPLHPTNADVLAAVQAMAAEAAAFRVAVASQLHALEERVSAVDTLQRAASGPGSHEAVWLQREVQRVEVERV